jgi:replicative DNA helicase
VAELQSGNNPVALRTVKTGFSNLDYYLNGLVAGSLTVIAARPSLGKTSLAVNMAMNAVTREQKNVLFFSLEMAKEEISDRITASLLGVSTWQMQKGDLSDAQVGDLGGVIDQVRNLPLFIDDDPDSTISNIRAKAIRHQLEHGLDLLVVDYLQLIEPPSGTSRENRVQEVSAISRGLKKLAKELHAPVIALSQLNRAVENRPKCIPHLADLRDSGTIEQDADIVLMLWRESAYEEDCDHPEQTTVFIRKNRQGPTGAAELVFDQEKMTFTPLERIHTAESA